jgi:hypothetical protein
MIERGIEESWYERDCERGAEKYRHPTAFVVSPIHDAQIVRGDDPSLVNHVRSYRKDAPASVIARSSGSNNDLTSDNGRQRLVRHGHLPEREIMTGHRPGRAALRDS